MSDSLSTVDSVHTALETGLQTIINNSTLDKHRNFALTYYNASQQLFSALKKSDVRPSIEASDFGSRLGDIESRFQQNVASQKWSRALADGYSLIDISKQIASTIPGAPRMAVSTLPGVPIWTPDDDS